MIAYPLGVDGTITRVLESGSGSGLVLVHGLGSRADRWRASMQGLANSGRRVLAFDLPGHGFSAKDPKFNYSVAGYRRFLEAFLDANRLARAAIVGASFGGQIAAAFAAQAPERVEALVLVGSTGLAPFGAEARAQTARTLVDMSRDAIGLRLQRGLRNVALISDELIEEDFRINNAPGADDVFRALGRYFAERIDEDVVLDGLAALGGRLPILLLWGAEDLSISVDVAQAARAGLPGSHLAVIAGTAHNPYMDKPDIFNRVLLDFLSGRVGAFQSPDVSYR